MASFASNYKETTTSRGIKYRYYYAPQTDTTKTFLVFLHGFPSTVLDWRRQIEYFRPKGYGIIAPDMLGYGGTDKPTDASAYAYSLLAKDIIDILDAEKVVNPIIVGHDWGAKATSAIANRYQNRFAAFAFIAVGYQHPNTNTYEEWTKMFEGTIGFDFGGYWEFFSTEGTDKILQQHTNSFLDIMYAKDIGLWKDNFCPKGACQAWVESDKRTARGDYFSDEEGKAIEEYFLKNGFAAPLNYYKVMTSNIDVDDNKGIPAENYSIGKPVFFAGGSQDPTYALQEAETAKYSLQITSKVLDGGHWVHLEASAELNPALENWLSTVIRESVVG